MWGFEHLLLDFGHLVDSGLLLGSDHLIAPEYPLGLYHLPDSDHMLDSDHLLDPENVLYSGHLLDFGHLLFGLYICMISFLKWALTSWFWAFPFCLGVQPSEGCRSGLVHSWSILPHTLLMPC